LTIIWAVLFTTKNTKIHEGKKQIKITNLKHQISNKFQNTISKLHENLKYLWLVVWNFEFCSLEFICYLEFVICFFIILQKEPTLISSK